MARKPDALGFRSFVVFFWSEFKRLEKNDKTKKFISKLDNIEVYGLTFDRKKL